MRLRQRWLGCSLAALLLASAACSTRTPPPPIPVREDTVFVRADPARTYPNVETIQLARLTKLYCPRGTGEAETRSIGSQGGTIVLRAGHSLEIPAGAVQNDTRFTLIDEAHSKHLTVRAYGDGQPFKGPVFLTISSDRCDPGQIENRELRIIRERLSGPADDLGGDQVPNRRAIRTELDRLSGFAVSF